MSEDEVTNELARPYEFKRVLVTRIELDQEAVNAILLKEFKAPPKAWVEWEDQWNCSIKWTEEPESQK